MCRRSLASSPCSQDSSSPRALRTATSPASLTIWCGTPSISRYVVRSTSWRSTTSRTAAINASTSHGPVILAANGMLLTGLGPSMRYWNHIRSWDADICSGPSCGMATSRGRLESMADVESMRSASLATVPSSKTSRTPMSTLNCDRTAATSLVASSEWPPRSKNESSAPTRSRPSSSANRSATRLLGALGGLAVDSAPEQNVWLRQRVAVDLAVRGDRDLVDHNVGGGRHVLRQRGGDPDRTRSMSTSSAGVGRGQIANEALAEIGQVADHHDRLANAGVDGDRGGHFAEFDPEAADLDLFVRAPDELDIAVGVAAGEVTRTVEPAARGERIGDEPFGGQPVPAVVAVRDMCSTDIDFADDADRHRPHARRRAGGSAC